MQRPSLPRRARGPLSLLATASVAAALLATSVAPASAGKGSPPPGRKRTVVLVHGAFADSSSWNGVVQRLSREGYPVVAAANPLRGLGIDAAYLKEVLAEIDGPVVPAGHSYGGSVISDAAQGVKNGKALVCIAAFLPEKGENAVELSGTFPGTEDRSIPRKAQYFTADRAHAYTTEVRTSHAVSVSRPGEVVRVIEAAAGAAR
ncbi:alpha/beta fold hydrolase [Streptomyces sp. NPDC096311]|uniref:alpha/beta fold hydrolase n=1 Tax=Streptomyces sp. NPDC096311 TaxID=3366083 RepID=UPI00381872B2